MKKFITACVAVLSLIGINYMPVEAVMDDQVIKDDTLWKLRQQHGVTVDSIKVDKRLLSDFMLIDEVLQIPDPKESVLMLNQENQAVEFKGEKTEEKSAMSLSNEEKDLFARLVEAEAKGESYEGKVAVATVVLNRVESPEFPNTVTNVIYEVVGSAYAFSPVQNGEINKPASEESKQAVDEALTRKAQLHDSVYFYNPEITTDSWIRSREVITIIGNHVFAK